MSKFLTPPVWHDSNGNLVEILTGEVADYGGTERLTGSMAIGNGAYVGGGYSVAVGDSAIIYDEKTTAIGYNVVSRGNGNIVIGCKAESVSDSGNGENIAIGQNNGVYGDGNIAIGKNSKVYGAGSIAIGSGITLGTDESPLNYTIQIGSSDKTYSAQIGNGLNTTLKCTAERAQKSSFADFATKWNALSNTQWIDSSVDSSGKYYFAEITGTSGWYQVMLTNGGVAYTDGVDFCSTILQFQGTSSRTGKQLIAVVVPQNISSDIYYYFAAIDNSNRGPSGNRISRIEVTRYRPAIGTTTQSETTYVPFEYRRLE